MLECPAHSHSIRLCTHTHPTTTTSILHHTLYSSDLDATLSCDLEGFPCLWRIRTLSLSFSLPISLGISSLSTSFYFISPPYFLQVLEYAIITSFLPSHYYPYHSSPSPSFLLHSHHLLSRPILFYSPSLFFSPATNMHISAHRLSIFTRNPLQHQYPVPNIYPLTSITNQVYSHSLFPALTTSTPPLTKQVQKSLIEFIYLFISLDTRDLEA